MAAEDLVNAIRKRGFRKWYERQLVESHLCLVTCLLCAILVLACVEELNFRAGGLKPFVLLAVGAGGGLLGLVSWRRYAAIMTVAGHYGEHSTCPACKMYGRFEIIDWGDPAPVQRTADTETLGAGAWLKVRCRKCGHAWTMD